MILIEAAAIGLVVALAAVFLLEKRLRPLAALTASLGLGLGAGCLAAWADSERTPPLTERGVRERPVEIEMAGHVGPGACQACHPGEHASWTDSWHRTMTQLVEPGTLLGPLQDSWELDGQVWGLTWEGDELIATTPEGESRRAMLLTGSHHAQDIWIETPETGQDLELFPFEYRADLGRWIPMREAFLQPQGEGEHTIGTWNRNCIQCHTTSGETWVYEEDVLLSRVADFGIACEACHGPGEEHVAAHQEPLGRMLGERGHDDTVVNPADLDPRRSAEVCGQCHGIWHGPEGDYTPGDVLADHRDYEIMDALAGDWAKLDTWFWRDGQVRISGREYTGLRESPCYQTGEASCLDCHRMHQSDDDERAAKVWANDQLREDLSEDEQCTQCHVVADDHTRHDADSEGARCQNCHAPYTTWGVLKGIRSHTVGSPSVTESLEVGRPNACNLCHQDRTLAWTNQALVAWGVQPVDVPAPHDEVAAVAVWSLSGDAGLRALMAWHLGWAPAREASGTGWQRRYLDHLARDPYPAVRTVASKHLDALPADEAFSARPELLVREDGSVDERFGLLAAERDDKRVVLAE